MKEASGLFETVNGVDLPTEEGRQLLSGVFTNIDKNIYIIKNSLNPTISAAAMARLSRSHDDLRMVVLKEFSGSISDSGGDSIIDQDASNQEEQLLARVISQYGDDSVQQLGVVYGAVEGASNLLTKDLEWGPISGLFRAVNQIYSL